MAEKFKGRYRNASARLQNWDYGSDAAYFITICTKEREHFFGEINNRVMKVSPAGAIAHVMWAEIKNHAPNVELDEFVVMPNHLHGIICLNGNSKEIANPFDLEIMHEENFKAMHGLNHQQQYQIKTPGQRRFQNQGRNTISSIVGSYKSSVTKYCNQLGLNVIWQPRFHDHIIRNHQSYLQIADYISNNVVNWKKDRLY